MKKILLFALPLLAMCFASCEKDKGEEWTDDSPIIQFKDPKFLEDLITQGFYNHQTGEFKPSIDKNADGQISEKEASVVTKLSVYNDIRNIDEIKYFALTWLKCSGNQLTTLDLSKNTALTYLSCYANQLTSLDLSKNTALTYLSCSDNPLQKLILYKYHIIDDSYMEDIIEEYGDIIEYVE